MKAKLAVLSVMAAVSAIPANAAAAPPQREPVPGDVITEPAGAVCDFPIAITPLKLREKVTSFSDGRVRLTGVAIVEVSNVDNGRSIGHQLVGPRLAGPQQRAGRAAVLPVPERRRRTRDLPLSRQRDVHTRRGGQLHEHHGDRDAQRQPLRGDRLTQRDAEARAINP
jgi:hypothetical protein